MGKLIDVVYDAEGNVIALGFPPPPHLANVQHQSGPEVQPGQTAAQLELPAELTAERHPDLSGLKVDTQAAPHKLVIAQ
jgi:hypothetical protein